MCLFLLIRIICSLNTRMPTVYRVLSRRHVSFRIFIEFRSNQGSCFVVIRLRLSSVDPHMVLLMYKLIQNPANLLQMTWTVLTRFGIILLWILDIVLLRTVGHDLKLIAMCSCLDDHSFLYFHLTLIVCRPLINVLKFWSTILELPPWSKK